jgi:hypothetical protein
MSDLLQEWPNWWSWELELTPHLLKRMTDRHFNEVDLRTMLSVATDYAIQLHTEGRFIIYTKHQNRLWEVIVEPDFTDRVLLVITAYSRD